MDGKEFLSGFDVLFNNITSNQGPGLNVHEVSLFLTKAEHEIIKNHFNPASKGNTTGQGFDDSVKRQADFSSLLKTGRCYKETVGSGDIMTVSTFVCKNTENERQLLLIGEGTISFSSDADEGEHTVDAVTVDGEDFLVLDNDTDIIVTGFPYEEGGTVTIGHNTFYTVDIEQIDSRSSVFRYPSDVFLPLNEVYRVNDRNLQITPLKYEEYRRLMSRPYKRPLQDQAWKLINGSIGADRYIELIAGPDADNADGIYIIRYIRRPKPIIAGSLEGNTIDGYCFIGDKELYSLDDSIQETDGCELDPVLHDEILQRAVELAKTAWVSAGSEGAQAMIQTGVRSE